MVAHEKTACCVSISVRVFISNKRITYVILHLKSFVVAAAAAVVKE